MMMQAADFAFGPSYEVLKFGYENKMANRLNRITNNNCHFLNCTIKLKVFYFIN